MTSSTRDRLIAATLDLLAERGSAATTKAIADAAGVNEVTLFRQFGSKTTLMATALAAAIAPFVNSLDEPTGDLNADLGHVAAGYVAFVDAHPKLVARLMPEIAHGEGFAMVADMQKTLAGKLRSIFERHQRAGRLAAEPMADAVRAFMGPLVARATLSHLVESTPFDGARYVDRFLSGYGINST